MDDNDIGPRLIELPGEPACRELLDVLQRPEEERAALIGRLYQREDVESLAEMRIGGAGKVVETASPLDAGAASKA